MMTTAATEKPKKSVKREIFEWLICFGVAFAVFGLVNTYAFAMIRVDGASMNETLKDGDRMFVTKWDMRNGEPERLDVVICNYPQGGAYRVKRVIALPGETVQIEGGTVYINGEPLVEEAYIEHKSIRPFGPVTVPEGEYFVLGDNRNNSSDSTDAKVGTLKKDAIVGRARLVWWPFGRFHNLETGGKENNE